MAPPPTPVSSPAVRLGERRSRSVVADVLTSVLVFVVSAWAGRTAVMWFAGV